MARGESGRIVIEVDPDIKKELYQRLEVENCNLKAWFLGQVEEYLSDDNQLLLELDCESPTPSEIRKS